MAHNKNHNQTQTSHSPFTQPIRCIVKLGITPSFSLLLLLTVIFLQSIVLLNLMCSSGGAAITCKNELEKINEEILYKVSQQLRQAMIATSQKPPGMDWSKIPGESEICYKPEEFGDDHVSECSRFIVVHGAGSLVFFLFQINIQ